MARLRGWGQGLLMTRDRTLAVGVVLTMAGLAALGADGIVSARGADKGRIRGIDVRETETDTWLIVRGAESPTFSAYKQGEPPRLLVDIAGADVSRVDSPIEVRNGVVHTVVTEQLKGGVARVVVSLERDAGFDIKLEGGDLLIRIDALGRVTGPGTAGRMPESLRRLEAEVRSRLRQEERRIIDRRRELEAAIASSQADAKKKGALETQLSSLQKELNALTARRQEEERRLVALRAAVTAEEERRLEAEEATRRAADARKRAAAATADVVREAALYEAKQMDAAGAEAAADARRIAARRDREVQARLAELEMRAVRAEGRVADAEARADVHASAAQAAIAAAQRARREQGKGRVRLTDVRFEDSIDRSQVIIEADGVLQHSLRPAKDGTLVLQLDNVLVPRRLERKLDTRAFSSPVVGVTSYGGNPDDGKGRVVVELAEATDSRVRVQGKRLVWEFRKQGASPRGWEKAIRPSGPRRPPLAAGAKRAGQRPAGSFEIGRVGAFSGTTGKTFAGMVKQGAGSGFGGASSPQRFTGKRITIDLKDADIHNVLRLLAKEGRINVIASEDVSGTITLHLERIPWDQALDVILRTKGLTQRREGDIVWVTPLKILKEQEKIRVEVKKAQEQLEPLEVRLITVNYASGGGLIAQIQTVLSKRGVTSLDTRTNTIIIKDIAEHADAAEDLVRRLDSQTPLILIEARIVEASNSFTEEMGIQWGGDFSLSPASGNPTGLVFPNIVTVTGGSDDNNTNTTGTASTPNFVVNLPAAAGTGSGASMGFQFGSIGDTVNINLRLSAAEDSGSIKLLASPRIATLDNSEAIIKQGVSIPVSVISAQGVNTVFFEANLELKVTPHVTQDGNVILDTKITKNTPDFANTGSRGDPSIQTKEAKTQMMVKDGDTAVIGGIYTKEDSYSVKKVPFFGDIPIIGFLFRFERRKKTRTELLIFLTPRIVNRAAASVQGGRAAGSATFK